MDGILSFFFFFHCGGGGQIMESMKRKVTLGRERSAHSLLSYPVASHPSQVPHLSRVQKDVHRLHHE